MKKKVSTVLVSSVLILPGLFVLLPILLSSDGVLDRVLNRINRQSGATLKIANCDIGWQQGLVCSEIEYSAPEVGLHLTAAGVSGNRGLLALLAAPGNLGTLRVQQPVVTIGERMSGAAASGEGSASVPAVDTAGKTGGAKLSPGSRPDETKAPFWDTLVVSLVVEEGRVIAPGQNSDASALDGIFSGTTALAAGTVKYTLQWLAGQGKGTLIADGFVNLPARRFNILDTLVARMQLQVSDLQIAPLLSMAARKTRVPRGSGLLNGELTITGAGPDNLDIIGNLECTDAEFSGGFFGDDHPRMQRLSLRIDGKNKGSDGWHVSRLDLEGDPGKISAAGEYSHGTGLARITGQIQLPVVFSQFPHFFHIRETTVVSGGALNFSADLDMNGEQRRISVEAAVESVQGMYGSHSFSWDKAADLTFTVEQVGNGFSFPAAGNMQRSGTFMTGSYTLTTQVYLESLSRLLHNLQIMPGETTVAGTLKGFAGGFFTEDRIILRELDLRVKDFILQQGERVVTENNLILQTTKPLMVKDVPIGIRKLVPAESMTSWRKRGFGLSCFDRVKRQLILRNMELHSTLADLDIEALEVDNLDQPMESWRTRLRGRGDPSVLSSLFPGASLQVENPHLTGQGRSVSPADQQPDGHGAEPGLSAGGSGNEKAGQAGGASGTERSDN